MSSGTYLLDTHALLWALAEPARLGQAALAAIEDPTSTLFVSSATVWELATKHRLGRLPQADAVLAAYFRHLSRLGARELPMSSEHAMLAGGLDWTHRDPFDRMLAAQCMVESLTLISRDRAFAELTTLAAVW